jgi:hypothetical protein
VVTTLAEALGALRPESRPAQLEAKATAAPPNRPALKTTDVALRR